MTVLAAIPDLASMEAAGPAGPVPPLSNVRVDTGVGSSTSPALAAEPWGRVHAAWQDNRTGTPGIHYATSLDYGAVWTSDVRIDSPGPGTESYEPDIAVDLSRGAYNASVYIVWRTFAAGAGDVWIVRSPNGGGTWTTAVALDQGPSSVATYHPSVAVDDIGRVFVVWADDRDGTGFQVFLRTSSDGGGTWTPESTLSTAGVQNLRPVVDARGGAAYAAWIRTDLSSRYAVDVVASVDGGVTWTGAEVTVRFLPETIRDFDIAAGPTGDLHLVFTSIDGTASQRIEYVRSDELGGSFSAPQTVTIAPTGPTIKDARIAVLGPVVAVGWSVRPPPSTSDYDVYYAWSAGGAWSTAIRVDDTDSNGNPADDASGQDRPVLAAAGSVLAFAWVDGRSGGLADVYSSIAEWDEPLITEVRDSPDGQEFIELYGWSRTPTSMAGWSLEIDATRFDIGGLGAISPGTFLVVGDSPSATLELPIDIPDEGAVVRLVRPGGIGDVEGFGQKGVAPDPRPGESIARFTDGIAYGRAWAWEPNPTPRGSSAVPAPRLRPAVVLNEVLFNPSDPTTGFVELNYRGTGPMTVSGLVVMGDTGFALPPIDFSTQQRSYVVFAADAPNLFTSLDVAGDNVYLRDTPGRLWDEAGWSTPHVIDRTMARIPDGGGSHDGFDDASSRIAGWVFDMSPSLAGIRIEPDGQGTGDLGEVVGYDLTVTNELRYADDVELEASSGPTGWRVDLLEADGATPIVDTNGNGEPDLPAMAPLESRAIVVRVSIPATPPIGDTEVTTITASASSQGMIRATARLSTGTVPHIDPRKWADPTTIYAEGSPAPLVTETTIHLEIVGSGQAITQRFPQDTIFVVDSSGSMTQPPWNSDPTGVRIDAIKAYIDGMAATDRAAIVGFGYDSDYFMDTGAWLANDMGGGMPTHLTGTDPLGKLLLKTDAETLRFGNGGTNIEKALQVAHQEFLPAYTPSPACVDYPRPFPQPPAGGMAGHMWVEILLTDGIPSHAQLCTDDELAVAATNRIRIFTIGLGDAVDSTYLTDIATRTGGKFYRARSAGDLLAVYEEIATVVNRIAGYDGDVNDDLPMIMDVVPVGVNVVPGSFVDPATGGSRPPAWQQRVAGRTLLEWNVTQLEIGESWAVDYRVSTPRVGRVSVSAYPEARVTYLRWDSRSVTLSFPPVEVDVLGTPPHEVTYTLARSPDRGPVYVDGDAYPAPAIFTWITGEVHTIFVPSVDGFGPEERDVFDRWDDGGARTHLITVGAVDARITAFFITQVVANIEASGLSPSAGASVSFRALGGSFSVSTSESWTDWVDVGSPLAIENPVVIAPTERYASRDASAWTVTGPFEAHVAYYHQWKVRVTAVGLHAGHPAGLRGVGFGSPVASSLWSGWEDWIDDGGDLSVDPVVQAGPRERFITGDTTAWVTLSAIPRIVRYEHEYRPSVTLVGTDGDHTVSLTIRDDDEADVLRGVHANWADWVEAGGLLEFSRNTSGSPARVAIDRTTLVVTSPFDATIRYAPPSQNMKPLISLVYVAAIIGVAAVVAHRRPLDLVLSHAGANARRAGVNGTPPGFREVDDAARRHLVNRWLTFLRIGAPIAMLEGVVGLLSLQTGFLRVPEEGSWLCTGLVVNSVLLALAIGIDAVAHGRGYRPTLPAIKGRPQVVRNGRTPR